MALCADIADIQDIAHKTWPSTYGDIISSDQIEYMLEMMYEPEALERQMFEGKHFLIAETQKEGPIGFASYGNIGSGIFKLHKLYVLPKCHGKGAGKQMLKAILDKVIDLGGKELLLQVNKKNKAVSFYQKMGFSIVREYDLDIGRGYWMNDYVMSLYL